MAVDLATFVTWAVLQTNPVSGKASLPTKSTFTHITKYRVGNLHIYLYLRLYSVTMGKGYLAILTF